MQYARKFPIPAGRGNLLIKTFRGKKISIIDESYNANPISVDNAINNFCLLNTKKEKIAIIGDMLELGSKSKFYHQQLANSLSPKPSFFGNYPIVISLVAIRCFAQKKL